MACDYKDKCYRHKQFYKSIFFLCLSTGCSRRPAEMEGWVDASSETGEQESLGCRFSITFMHTSRHTRIILAILQENTTVWNTVFFLFSPQLTLYLGKRDYVDNVSVVDKVGTFLLCAHTERMVTKYRYNNITTTLLPAEGVVKLDPKDFGDRKGNNNNILPSWSIWCYKPSAWSNGSVLFALSVCAAGVCLPLR